MCSKVLTHSFNATCSFCHNRGDLVYVDCCHRRLIAQHLVTVTATGCAPASALSCALPAHCGCFEGARAAVLQKARVPCCGCGSHPCLLCCCLPQGLMLGEEGTLLRLSRVMGYDACAMCSALASLIYMAWHSLTGVLGWVQGVWRGSLGWAGWQAPGGTVQATAVLH